MIGAAFVVAGQPAVAHQPPECALNDPPATDDLEAVRAGALDNRQGDRGGGLDERGDRGALVAAVCPHDLERADGVEQPDDQKLEPGPVADGRGGDNERQQPALNVDGEVPTPAGDLLPAVVAPGPHLVRTGGLAQPGPRRVPARHRGRVSHPGRPAHPGHLSANRWARCRLHGQVMWWCWQFRVDHLAVRLNAVVFPLRGDER